MHTGCKDGCCGWNIRPIRKEGTQSWKNKHIWGFHEPLMSASHYKLGYWQVTEGFKTVSLNKISFLRRNNDTNPLNIVNPT